MGVSVCAKAISALEPWLALELATGAVFIFLQCLLGAERLLGTDRNQCGNSTSSSKQVCVYHLFAFQVIPCSDFTKHKIAFLKSGTTH